jgi:hypothetical protein
MLSLIEHSVSSTSRGGLRVATQSDIAAVDPTKSATATEEMRLEVTIDPAVAARARRAVERMRRRARLRRLCRPGPSRSTLWRRAAPWPARRPAWAPAAMRSSDRPSRRR